jgi:hypothetical protein
VNSINQRNRKKEAKTHLKAAEALFKKMSMNFWLEETGKITVQKTKASRK